jgi:LacI family transcriptional regulator, galactose operon repressor
VTDHKLPGKRATIRDVARRAGVSHQTVSRVINGSSHVTEPTRERVLGAIRELAYVPSPMARGLIANRTHSLGMVSAEISDYAFAEAVAGAEAETRRRGYYLMVASVEDESRDDERGYLRLMLARRVEGLIVARPSVPLSSEQLLPAVAAGVPLVAIGSSQLPGFTVVDVDNLDGGRQATALLVAQGHRRIATITGPREWPSAKARLEGYRRALRAGGLGRDRSLVETSPGWGLEDGRAAAARLLDQGQAFTGLFAQSDLIALGAIRELRARGLRVPEDVSVVGYDDIPVAAFVHPALTTVRQPIRQVGEMAARIVLDGLAAAEAGDGAPRPDTHLLPAELVVRDTVGPPRST